VCPSTGRDQSPERVRDPTDADDYPADRTVSPDDGEDDNPEIVGSSTIEWLKRDMLPPSGHYGGDDDEDDDYRQIRKRFGLISV
jgi:hypothetical protein